jgi:aminoglycoside/choline kinase family phosphotransferase
MLKGNKLPESLVKFVACRPGARCDRIRSEASRRQFYRVNWGKKGLVAMVYPEPSRAEVGKFCAVQKIYHAHGLRVPRIEQVLADQVVIQEDAGDILLQRAWRDGNARERRRLTGQCLEILARLASIPAGMANARLDAVRQKWEMDFFITHFQPRFPARSIGKDDLRAALHRMVEAIAPEDTYAHRDFHSRNLLVLNSGIVLVDFQDSLLAPRFYDLVSLAFDSYLDLGPARGKLFPNLAAGGDDPQLRQMRLTALQRNIKALGTFAYQIYERRHPSYARYIPRTIRHIQGHLNVLADPGLAVLSKYFFILQAFD